MKEMCYKMVYTRLRVRVQGDEEALVVSGRVEPAWQRARHVQLEPALRAGARVYLRHALHFNAPGNDSLLEENQLTWKTRPWNFMNVSELFCLQNYLLL